MSDDDAAPSDALDRLETLEAMLTAALRLVREIEGDPLLTRWLATYHAMSTDERPVVVEAVEREVKASVLTRATQDVTGQGMHPNPHARLYLRSVQRDIPRVAVETETMRRATLRAMQVIGVVTRTPALWAQWRAATQQALAELDRTQREAVEMLARELVRLLDEPMGVVPAAPSPSSPPPVARSTRGKKSRS